MSDVTVIETEQEPEPTVVVVDAGDDDSVIEAATLDHVERITRLEDTVTLLTAAIESLTEQVAALTVVDEMQEMEIRNVAEEVENVAEDTAEVITDVVEEVDEASPEITPDEVPTVREHPFFRKWGKR